MGKKERIKYDSEYIAYVESGESAAVFVARDIANGIDLKGNWIDIIHYDGRFVPDSGWAFTNIRIELFPRKSNPQYSKHMSDEEKKYITWQAAHKDINELKSRKYHGPRYDLKVKSGSKYEVKSAKRIK